MSTSKSSGQWSVYRATAACSSPPHWTHPHGVSGGRGAACCSGLRLTMAVRPWKSMSNRSQLPAHSAHTAWIKKNVLPPRMAPVGYPTSRSRLGGCQLYCTPPGCSSQKRPLPQGQRRRTWKIKPSVGMTSGTVHPTKCEGISVTSHPLDFRRRTSYSLRSPSRRIARPRNLSPVTRAPGASYPCRPGSSVRAQLPSPQTVDNPPKARRWHPPQHRE